MKKRVLVILSALLGGLLATGLLIAACSAAGLWLNYRQFQAGDVMLAWATSFWLLYSISVYAIAILLYRYYPNRTRPWRSWQRKRLVPKLVVPALLFLLLVVVNNNAFPVAFATAEARQQWGYKEFSDYRYVIDDITNCEPIQARIGEVAIVAPT